jgi:hypothetical protein
VRSGHVVLRLPPALLAELRSVAALEGVAVDRWIEVAIAEKLAQLRSRQRFADRIAGADPEAGEHLIRDLSRGGGEKPKQGDARATRASRAKAASSAK